MRCLLLLLIVPCCAFSVFATERIEGEIALSAPQCDLFVVQTAASHFYTRMATTASLRATGSRDHFIP